MQKIEIKNLSVEIDNKEIINDFNLTINSGEIHTIMGPNGVGKSSLLKTIMGDPKYTITKGDILIDGTSILNLKVNERSKKGIFLGMQMPNEIEGVTTADLMRSALRDDENFKLYGFVKEINGLCDKLSFDKEMLHRSINLGFSGGEKKKNEILQMYMLKPSLVLLDEIDSGLDMDSLKIVASSIMEYFEEKKPAILMITHYENILDYIKPDYVHIMLDGKIVKNGDLSLVKEIEENGYNLFKECTNEVDVNDKNE